MLEVLQVEEEGITYSEEEPLGSLTLRELSQRSVPWH